MKVQVLYASRSGCTEKVARAIYGGLTDCEASIHNLKDGIPTLDGDILLVGYWGVSGGPDEETRAFLQTISGKAVGVFCTLGYYADTEHAHQTLRTGVDLLKDRNEIIGGYVCNGAVDISLKKGRSLDEGVIPANQKELRWAMTDSHPTAAECILAAERFRERIWLYSRCREKRIPFQSVL